MSPNKCKLFAFVKKCRISAKKKTLLTIPEDNAKRKSRPYRVGIRLPVHTKKRANAYQHPITSRNTSYSSGHCRKYKDHCARSSVIDSRSARSCDGGDDDYSLVHARARVRSVRRIGMRLYQYFDFHSSWNGLL
jgi:hypothetical protein